MLGLVYPEIDLNIEGGGKKINKTVIKFKSSLILCIILIYASFL